MSEHDPIEDYDDLSWRKRVKADHLFERTAVALWALGLIQLVPSVLCLGAALWTIFEIVADEGGFVSSADMKSGVIFGVAGTCGTIFNGVILIGATGMRRDRRYRLAVAASVLTILSMPCLVAFPISMCLGCLAMAL